MKWFKNRKEKRVKSHDDSRLPTIKEIIRDNLESGDLEIRRNLKHPLAVYIDGKIGAVDRKLLTYSDEIVFSRDFISVTIDLYSLSFDTIEAPWGHEGVTTKEQMWLINFVQSLGYSFFLFAEKTVGDTIRSMFINESVVTDEHKEIMRILLNEIFDDYFDLFLIEEAANERLNLEEELLEEERSREQKKRASEKANEMLSPYRSSEFKAKLNELKKELDNQ